MSEHDDAIIDGQAELLNKLNARIDQLLAIVAELQITVAELRAKLELQKRPDAGPT